MSVLLVRTIVAVALLTYCSANRLFFPATDELFQAIMGEGVYHYPVADEPINPSKGGGVAPEVAQQQRPEASTGIKEPSKCVWAILACCIPGSERVNIACFEEKGCHGNFFDRSPCRRESAANAHRIMMRYQAMIDAMKREELASKVQEAGAEAQEPTPHSPFAPVGPLPSREEAGIPY